MGTQTSYEVKISDKCTFLPNMSEKKPERLSVKGTSVLNVFGADWFGKNNFVRYLEFPYQHNITTINSERNHILIDKTGILWNAMGLASFKISTPAIPGYNIKAGKPYTMIYRINKLEKYEEIAFQSETGRPKILSQNDDAYLDMSLGLHATAFIPTNSNSITIFEMNPGATAPCTDFILDFEFLGIFEGIYTKSPINNLLPTSGIFTVNSLHITSQKIAPILGEYVLGGDVPKHFANMERIINNRKNTYAVDWR